MLALLWRAGVKEGGSVKFWGERGLGIQQSDRATHAQNVETLGLHTLMKELIRRKELQRVKPLQEEATWTFSGFSRL